MNLQRAIATRQRGEDGAALPLALMFLVLFGVVFGLVFTYIGAGMATNRKLQVERNDLFAVSGGIDAAINQVRNDGTLGTSTSTSSCGTTGVAANGVSVNVACVADTGSGAPIPTTAAPPFAILTMAPFVQTSPLTWSGNTPPNCVNLPPGELGVVQVQDSKLLTVTGNVFVNSDADSDVWSNGCPQTTTAKHIVVNGAVKQRSSCHDIDPSNDSYDWLCGAVSSQANPTPDPGLATHRDGPLGGTADADLNDPAIAQPNSWALPFSTPPAVQTVPACPAGNVVAFNPGTYTDGAALSTLMNGVSCPGRVFWFKPGQYYFNFTNTGSHEWSINDGRAKVVAGQPTAVTTGGTSIGPTRWTPSTAATSGWTTPDNAKTIGDGLNADVQLGNITTTTGPTTWTATGASSSTFANPGNAVAIDGTTATAVLSGGSTTGTLTATAPVLNGQPGGNNGFNTNPDNARAINGTSAATTNFTTGTRSITLQNYAGTGAPVPAGATITGVSLQVAHNEGNSNTQRGLVNNPTVTVTPGGAASCGALTVTKSTANNSTPITQTFADVMTNCLNTPAKVNGATVAYAVAHSGNSGTATPTIDGMTLTVTYTTGTPSGSVTVTGFSGGGAIPAGATINTVTMSVAHNEGSTSGTTVNLPSVTLPGCTTNLTRRSTMATETVTLAGSCLSVAELNAGPSLTFNASIPAGSPGTTVNLDGITLAVTYTATTTGVSGTATVTLSGYATTPATTIPDDATITSVRLRVAHGEEDPNLVGSPSVVITPANSGACAAVTIGKHAAVTEDAAPSYDVTSCFTLPAQINNGVSLQYRLAHCTPTGGTCTNAGTKAHLDGIWLDVTYVSNPRLPWDPNDPTANPNVPGACRHDGDPFWTDGVQWVFGGDSRINLQSGQMELCDKPSLRHADPSLDQQEIVLYGVKPAVTQTNSWTAATVAPTNTTTPCPTTIASGNSSTSFCQSASVQAIDGTTASVLTATNATVSKQVTLSGWSGTTIPPGSTINSVTARVTHRETSNWTSPSTVTLTGTATSCAPISSGLTANSNGTLATGSLSTVFVSLPTCVNNNIASLSLTFNANYSCSSGCPTIANPAGALLDGITIDISYTPSSTGGLNPQSGCIVQAPYYSPTDHSPNYDNDGAGPNPPACALIKITRPPLSQTPPPGDIRKLTLWGTAYAPASAFDLPVDLLPVPVFNRGVVARMLMLGYQVANSTQVPFTTVPLAGSTPINRSATFTATSGTKSTKVVAKVEFCDIGCPGVPPPTVGSPVSVVVHSWKVSR